MDRSTFLKTIGLGGMGFIIGPSIFQSMPESHVSLTVSEEIIKYAPMQYSLDSIMQVMGRFDITNQNIVEWTENDTEFLNAYNYD